MKTISGAILILAGVIPLCFGFMLDHADWYHQTDMPKALMAGGVVGMFVGLALLIWGLVAERAIRG
jgi:hypothetical protein